MKITDEQALQIIERYRNGQSVNDIAKEFSVGYHVAYRIVTGKTFRHLHGGDTKKIRSTDEDEIVELVRQGFSSTAVANKMGISSAAVGKVFKRNTGESISEYRKKKSVKYGQDVK